MSSKKEELRLVVTPNRILEVVGRFSLYQWRVYATIVELLETEAKKSFEGGQLAIQSFLDQQMILLSIPLKKISKPSEYRYVKKSLMAMSKTPFENTYTEKGKERIVSGSLFNVDMPNTSDWKSTVRIHIHPEVAKLFLTFRRDHKNDPIFYSKFSPDIVRKLKSIHTIKLYFLLCLWRNRETIFKKLDDLYQDLGLGTKYSRFSDFNKHILKPAYRDLLTNGDIWFDIEDPSFYQKQGARIAGLNFKVVTKRHVEYRGEKIKSVKNMLINARQFNDNDLSQLKEVFDRMTYLDLSRKVLDLLELVNANARINKPKEYIITSLNNELKNYEK